MVLEHRALQPSGELLEHRQVDIAVIDLGVDPLPEPSLQLDGILARRVQPADDAKDR